ncbi:hypothetical protein BHE90_016345 [Fusarium euwallaceae]|nr:hypothetical protein CEP53_014446 [Fusarium sp. AF-6]RTE69279.1 hypothetical protein BHE90_016345 [Fusarium euwallaceae]
MLKATVTQGLIDIMTPIQADFQASEEWQEVTLNAYPPPAKKEKKVKNRGTRFPGAKGGDAAKNAEQDGVTKKVEELSVADGAPAETAQPNGA